MIYQLAKQHDIFIIGEPLGDFHGYYNNIDDHKIIHVNTRVPQPFQKYVVAFLVYGAMKQPNKLLYLRKTAQEYTDREREAALFALRMHFSDLADEYINACESDRKQIEDNLKRLFVQDNLNSYEIIMNTIL